MVAPFADALFVAMTSRFAAEVGVLAPVVNATEYLAHAPDIDETVALA